jgi:hypothetical protein
VSLQGEAKEWYHSLNHSDGLDWEYLNKAFFLNYYSPLRLTVSVLIFTTFGFILAKVLLKLEGD